MHILNVATFTEINRENVTMSSRMKLTRIITIFTISHLSLPEILRKKFEGCCDGNSSSRFYKGEDPRQRKMHKFLSWEIWI